MDVCDQSAAAADFYLDIAIKNRTEVAEDPLLSAFDCDNCGDPIPEARRQAVPGCRLCVVCQTLEERNG